MSQGSGVSGVMEGGEFGVEDDMYIYRYIYDMI